MNKTPYTRDELLEGAVKLREMVKNCHPEGLKNYQRMLASLAALSTKGLDGNETADGLDNAGREQSL